MIIAIVIRMGVIAAKSVFPPPIPIQSIARPTSTVVYSDSKTLPAAQIIARTTSGI